MNSVTNKGEFQTSNKYKKLQRKNESLDRLKMSKKRIKASQNQAICQAFEEFKGVHGSIFYKKNVEQNPESSVAKAVKAHRRKMKRGNESDSYKPEKLTKEAAAGNARSLNRPAGVQEGTINHTMQEGNNKSINRAATIANL